MSREPEIDPKDPLWDLLRQSPRHQAGPRFVDDTVRAARLAKPDQPWWRRVWVPLSIGGLATAATAAVAIFVISQQQDTPEAPGFVGTAPPATETLDVLDDMVRTEALLIAADYPSEFTDAELVSLITY